MSTAATDSSKQPIKSAQHLSADDAPIRKRGRKPGSLNKKTIERMLGKRRGRKPKNLKEQIRRQYEINRIRAALTSGGE